MSLSVACRMGCVSGGRCGNGEAACCFPTSSVCSSVISHLQGREKRFSCCTAPSPVLCSFYTANALSSLLGCIQPQPSLASTFPFWSRFSLLYRREWSFSWSSPVTGTQELVSVLFKNSSGSRYSHLLPFFLSCKLQMTSPFKAGSFLKSMINIARLLVHLIVFYLSTQRLFDD